MHESIDKLIWIYFQKALSIWLRFTSVLMMFARMLSHDSLIRSFINHDKLTSCHESSAIKPVVGLN